MEEVEDMDRMMATMIIRIHQSLRTEYWRETSARSLTKPGDGKRWHDLETNHLRSMHRCLSRMPPRRRCEEKIVTWIGGCRTVLACPTQAMQSLKMTACQGRLPVPACLARDRGSRCQAGDWDEQE